MATEKTLRCYVCGHSYIVGRWCCKDARPKRKQLDADGVRRFLERLSEESRQRRRQKGVGRSGEAGVMESDRLRRGEIRQGRDAEPDGLGVHQDAGTVAAGGSLERPTAEDYDPDKWVR